MKIQTLTSRSATPEDSISLSELVNSAYRGDISKQGWTTEAALLGGQRTDSELLKKTIETDGSVC